MQAICCEVCCLLVCEVGAPSSFMEAGDALGEASGVKGIPELSYLPQI